MSTLSRTPARLHGRTVARRLLTGADARGMYALLSSFFSGVDDGTFAQDLGEKSHVILLEDDDGMLRGFSTLLVYDTRTAGADATVVYSGDTIVDREWWGSPALAVSWLPGITILCPCTDAANLIASAPFVPFAAVSASRRLRKPSPASTTSFAVVTVKVAIAPPPGPTGTGRLRTMADQDAH